MLSACSGATTGPSAAPRDKPASGSAAEVFFPLEEGMLYHYVTQENGDAGMLVARVRRQDRTHGELRIGKNTKRFVFDDAGVRYDGGAVILKNPVALGTSWQGEHGGNTTVTAVDAPVTVLAGKYNGCVVTVEEGGRLPGSRYTTTYCPLVGMVLLEVAAAGVSARAELKSYGAPVTIE